MPIEVAIFMLFFFGGAVLYFIYADDFVKSKNDKETKLRKTARGLVWLTNPFHLLGVAFVIGILIFLIESQIILIPLIILVFIIASFNPFG
mgnify:CR=1 FL=1|tara:strand:+ start:613 stop:885 length:273 start_codon:yes stop_codon:yes gene_type:complete